MFESIPLSPQGVKAVREAKNLMTHTAEVLMDNMAEGRAKAMFVTLLETAMHFGVRAICENNRDSISRAIDEKDYP